MRKVIHYQQPAPHQKNRSSLAVWGHPDEDPVDDSSLGKHARSACMRGGQDKCTYIDRCLAHKFICRIWLQERRAGWERRAGM